jgi:hypothetical protein
VNAFLSSTVGGLVLIAAGLGALGVIWSKGVKPVVVAVQHEIAERKRTSAMVTLMETHTRQLVTNGGAHVADKVNRVAEAVQRIEAKVDDAATAASEAKALVAEVKAHAAEAEEAATGQRDEIADRLTNWIEEGQVREAAYLASLAELGIDIPVQPRKETP